MSGTKYRVTANVQLNGAEEVLVKQGTTSGDTIATIASSGNHTIAGPNTSKGPIEMGRVLFLVRPTESELEGLNTSETVGNHSVGSQEQPTFPVHLSGLHGSTDPNLETSGSISRTFEQKTDTGPTALSLEVPEVLYQYYKSRDRTREYGAYVSDTYDDQYIKGIVNEFERFGKERGLNDAGIINQMMTFVQNLKYTSDKVSAGYNEYPKYPIETLVDREGDCEDSCILLASMLEQFGYGSTLLVFRDKQHMALGIAGGENIPGTSFQNDGQQYYYVETTAKGWGIGELPPEMEGGTPEFRPIHDSGVLVFSYAVDTPASGGAAVEVTMQNVGDGTGTAQAKVGFENANENLVASAQSQAKQLEPQAEYTTTLNILPPDDQQLRAKVQVIMDGTVQDTITSKWKSPQA
ncbi:copper amine oxidase [Halomicroarcula sp. GCM10025817]|uniref:copper amine oxidase n=1 Tax=Haloarcula TaxID=2237 RepID=UPI0023E81F5F|nr:copper amine oxidase [Halomicroarcula sp. SYNS111]